MRIMGSLLTGASLKMFIRVILKKKASISTFITEVFPVLLLTLFIKEKATVYLLFY